MAADTSCMIRSCLVALVVASAALPAWGQFLESEQASAGPTLGDARQQKFKVGLEVTADGGRCRIV